MTPEETAAWLRKQAAAAGLTPAEYARAYNAITPEQALKAYRKFTTPCIHCHRELRFHGSFARCADGDTQFTPAEPGGAA